MPRQGGYDCLDALAAECRLDHGLDMPDGAGRDPRGLPRARTRAREEHIGPGPRAARARGRRGWTWPGLPPRAHARRPARAARRWGQIRTLWHRLLGAV